MDMYEAIYLRKSVRRFNPLPQACFEEIEAIIERTSCLYPDINMKVHAVQDGKSIVNVMSSFGKIKAPHFLVATSEPQEGYLDNIGYLLEQVVLELTTLGIATCWIGGHVKDVDLLTS